MDNLTASNPSLPIQNPWNLLNPESLHDESPPPIILPTRQKAYGPGNPPSPITPSSPTRSPGGSFETDVHSPSGGDERNRDFYNRSSFLTSSPNPNELPAPNPSWSTSREGLYQTRLKNNQKQINDRRCTASWNNIIKNEAIKNICDKSQKLKRLSYNLRNLHAGPPALSSDAAALVDRLANEIIEETRKIKECVF